MNAVAYYTINVAGTHPITINVAGTHPIRVAIAGPFCPCSVRRTASGYEIEQVQEPVDPAVDTIRLADFLSILQGLGLRVQATREFALRVSASGFGSGPSALRQHLEAGFTRRS